MRIRLTNTGDVFLGVDFLSIEDALHGGYVSGDCPSSLGEYAWTPLHPGESAEVQCHVGITSWVECDPAVAIAGTVPFWTGRDRERCEPRWLRWPSPPVRSVTVDAEPGRMMGDSPRTAAPACHSHE